MPPRVKRYLPNRISRSNVVGVTKLITKRRSWIKQNAEQPKSVARKNAREKKNFVLRRRQSVRRRDKKQKQLKMHPVVQKLRATPKVEQQLLQGKTSLLARAIISASKTQQLSAPLKLMQRIGVSGILRLNRFTL